MKPVTRFPGIPVIVGLAGCTSSEPLQPHAGMAPAASLHENPNKPGAWIYRAPDIDLRRYNRFIVEPVTVYLGTGASYRGHYHIFVEQDVCLKPG